MEIFSPAHPLDFTSRVRREMKEKNYRLMHEYMAHKVRELRVLMPVVRVRTSERKQVYELDVDIACVCEVCVCVGFSMTVPALVHESYRNMSALTKYEEPSAQLMTKCIATKAI